MSEWRRRIAAALVVALAAAGATAQVELLAPSPPAEEPAPEPAPIAADGGPSDEAVRERLQAIFGAVEGLEGVEPEVRAGVVTLEGRAPDDAAAVEASDVAERVEGVVTVVDRIERSATAGEALAPGLQRLRTRAGEAARALPLIAVGLAIFLAFLLAGAALARWRAPFERFAPNAFVAELAAQATRIVAGLVGLVVALDFMGATALLGAILGAAGVLGLAVGFAVRDTIENYVSSVLLSVRQPFAPNDFVNIDGREGFVVRLTSRATVLLTVEGNHVRIPNAAVFRSVIVNYTHNPERRFDFELGVNADANLKAALAEGILALTRLDFVLLTPAPGGWIETVGDSNVVLRFVGWIDQNGTDFLQARSEALRLVKRALEEAGFELPEPIYRLRMEGAAAGAEAPAGRAAGMRPAEPEAVGDVRRQGSVEARASAERRERPDDLLSKPAPQE